MKASEVTLGQVFFKGQQNVIPLFQRPYVWTADDNWAPLWEDVRQATEDIAQPIGVGTKEKRTYFLGAIVLQDRDQDVGQVNLTNVIDGQQRLTTLQVLFAAARAISQGRGLDTVANKFDEMIFNSEKIVSTKYPNDRYKLWPLPQDLDAFLWAVDPQHHGVIPDDHKVVQAKSWFTETIGEWAESTSDPERHLEGLYETLHKRMQLVQIELEEGDDPQVIFEVLNNRGVQLDAADLVKNLLFQKIEKSDKNHLANALLKDVWLPLDKAPWRNEIVIGRKPRRQLDVLLSYWLPLQTGKATTVDHLFSDVKSWMNETHADAEETMRSIRKHADLMEALRARPITDRTGALVDRMTAIDLTTLWPLVLYFHANEDIPVDQREKAMVALDSFMMRRMLCRFATNSYTELMTVLLRAVMQVPAEIRGDKLEATLFAQTAAGRSWPTDDEVRSALAAPNFYNLFALKRSRTFLVSLDHALWTPNTSEVPAGRATGSKLTIEHLLPQQWEHHWAIKQVGSTEEQEARKIAREKSVHALGNLTLLTAKLNATVSNKGWKVKKKEISTQSLLLLTTTSVLNHPDGIQLNDEDWSTVWDEERIRLRGEWMTDLALRVWPRPK